VPDFATSRQTLNAATTPVWRHIAIVLDPADDNVSFFLDGQLGWKGPWGSKVAEADCPARKLAFGRRKRWDMGLEVGVYDARMYVGVALSRADVKRIATATATDGVTISMTDRCLDEVSSANIFDKKWTDEHNRGCEWYHTNRQEASSICTLRDPAHYCPVACRSRQLCFSPGVSSLLADARLRVTGRCSFSLFLLRSAPVIVAMCHRIYVIGNGHAMCCRAY